MCQFVETIKIFNKKIYNICYHNQRLNMTVKDNFKKLANIDLNKFIILPDDLDNDLYKCRVIYDSDIKLIEFVKYEKKIIRNLRIVKSDNIDYTYKSTNRYAINRLLKNKEECDDILIIKNDYITDTSYANVVFWDGYRWITPNTTLLKGTKRAYLLDNNKIFEADIKIEKIKEYQKIALINSMLEIGDIVVKIEDIVF